MEDVDKSTLIELSAEIASAYLSNNAVRPADVPDLIASLYGALNALGTAAAEPVAELLKPAVPVKKSVTDEYIISLEDGRKFKSLKRHLATAYGMTPEQYRAKWNLPRDYPLVAPAYAKQRSELARSIGLGRKAAAVAAEKPAAKEAPVKKRGRAKAA